MTEVAWWRFCALRRAHHDGNVGFRGTWCRASCLCVRSRTNLDAYTSTSSSFHPSHNSDPHSYPAPPPHTHKHTHQIPPPFVQVAGHQVNTTFAILDVKGVGLKHLTGETRRILSEIVEIDSVRGC